MFDATTSKFETELAGYDRLEDGCGLWPSSMLPWYGRLTGEDVVGWLQGQVTCDTRNWHVGTVKVGLICDPQGHSLAVLELWRLPTSVIVATDLQCKDHLLKRVAQMVILEDVVLTELNHLNVVSLQGTHATRELSARFELPTLDAAELNFDEMETIVLRADRSGRGGWDVLGNTSELPWELIDEASADAARLEFGIPKYGKDITFKTLLPEMGSVFENRHISYRKGCYTGQEILMRLHSRGHTNKTWMGLVSEEPVKAGEEVFTQVGMKIGKVTSDAFSPQFGYIAGAMLRNDAIFKGEIVHVGAGQTEAEVRTMPLLRYE